MSSRGADAAEIREKNQTNSSRRRKFTAMKSFQSPQRPGEKTLNRLTTFDLFVKLPITVIGLSFASPLHAQEPSVNIQAEKKLVLYHSPNVPDTEIILAGFRKKYPFVEVETYRSSGEKLIQKITAEARAGKQFADAYLLSGFQTWLLKSMGMLAAYSSPEREKVLPALKDQDGYWTGVYWNLEVLAYNTKMVAGPEIPKAWEDLLAPRWKGQIGLEEEDVDWYTAILQLKGEEKGKDFMRA